MEAGFNLKGETPTPHLPESVEEALTARTENLSFLFSFSAPARRGRKRCDTTKKINTVARCGTAHPSLFLKNVSLHFFYFLQLSHLNILLAKVHLYKKNQQRTLTPTLVNTGQNLTAITVIVCHQKLYNSIIFLQVVTGLSAF